MQTVEQFIDALGGTVAVAAAAEAPPSTVSSWKTANSIPRWRMTVLKFLAKEKGVPVPDKFAPRPTPAAKVA